MYIKASASHFFLFLFFIVSIILWSDSRRTVSTYFGLRRDSHLNAWCICWPRSRLNRTHAFSELGSRALRRVARRKSPKNQVSPPKPSRRSTPKDQNKWRVLQQTVHLRFYKAGNSYRFKIWVKVTCQIKETPACISNKHHIQMWPSI